MLEKQIIGGVIPHYHRRIQNESTKKAPKSPSKQYGGEKNQ